MRENQAYIFPMPDHKEELAEYFQEVLGDYREYPQDAGYDDGIRIEAMRRTGYKAARGCDEERNMKVNALDHVNIIAADLDDTARFYAELLGLERREAPAPLTPQTAAWMYDDAGRGIIHINSLDCPRTYQREVAPGPTGSIHHVALACAGFDEMILRLDARGADRQVNTVESIGLRQIFTMDPNGVLLELNFFGD